MFTRRGDAPLKSLYLWLKLFFLFFIMNLSTLYMSGVPLMIITVCRKPYITLGY